MELTLTVLLRELAAEVEQAQSLYKPLNSAHEAYGVLMEEVDEFWDEVKKRRVHQSPAAMRKELLQVAVVALRTIIDLDLPETDLRPVG